MIRVYDVPPDVLIKKLAEKLKEFPEMKPLEWVRYVKSGAHRERAPQQPDFWYIRCASLLRNVYLHSPIGVGKLRAKYGGRKQRGSKPEHHWDAGGSIIRKGLQSLEKIGFIENKKNGRWITPSGHSFVDKIVKEISKTKK